MVLHSPLTVTEHHHHDSLDLYEHDGEVYRHNRVYRSTRSKATGNEVLRELLIESDARVAYDRSLITTEIRPPQPRAKP